MDHSSSAGSSSALFQVYLRLKPPPTDSPNPTHAAELGDGAAERHLLVEEPSSPSDSPTHITAIPPANCKRRAVEKFSFTRVFQEDATQLDLLNGTELISLLESVLAVDEKLSRNGLVATLGVTGSGKSHTLLGSSSQRGLTQLAVEILFRSLDKRLLEAETAHSLVTSLEASDASEAHIVPATALLDMPKWDCPTDRTNSRAQTPLPAGREPSLHATSLGLYPAILGQSLRDAAGAKTGSARDAAGLHRRYVRQRLLALPQTPDVSHITLPVDQAAEYVVLVSMYEVYNDRIYDLLDAQNSAAQAQSHRPLRRRPLLFKPTEQSPEHKVVAGLRKVICTSLDEALVVLGLGLAERRVAGTGSNALSSRSHGFFCIELQKRQTRGHASSWSKTALTIVDLAGSERARNAKTAGATLAEAGKINESLMYLGQCLQLQGDRHDGNKSAVVPFRQCKLTELLFSNSFLAPSGAGGHHHHHHHNHLHSGGARLKPQKAIMIVTADPLGDFNATSQILRYSALAREVTVPRIPSVASTILSATAAAAAAAANGGAGGGNGAQQLLLSSGRTTPTMAAASTEELAFAAREMARLSEEVESLNIRLAEEQNRRQEAELALQALQERCDMMDQEIREECWAEAERQMEEERAKWKGAWYEEADRNDEHLDRKLEVLTRSFQIHEDPQNYAPSRLEELEAENAELRRKLDNAQREVHARSPTKKRAAAPPPKAKLAAPLAAAVLDEDVFAVENAASLLRGMSLHDSPAMIKPQTPSSTTKKLRKLGARTWGYEPNDYPF